MAMFNSYVELPEGNLYRNPWVYTSTMSTINLSEGDRKVQSDKVRIAVADMFQVNNRISIRMYI